MKNRTRKMLVGAVLSMSLVVSSFAMATPLDRQALKEKQQEIEQAQTEIASLQTQLAKIRSIRDTEVTIAYWSGLAIIAGGVWATIRGIIYGYDGASLGLGRKVVSGLYVITPMAASGASIYLAHVNSNQIDKILVDLSNEQHRLSSSQAALKEMLAD